MRLRKNETFYFHRCDDAKSIVEIDNKQSIKWEPKDVTINSKHHCGFFSAISRNRRCSSNFWIRIQWSILKNLTTIRCDFVHLFCVSELFAMEKKSTNKRKKNGRRSAIWLQVFQMDHYFSRIRHHRLLGEQKKCFKSKSCLLFE